MFEDKSRVSRVKLRKSVFSGCMTAEIGAPCVGTFEGDLGNQRETTITILPDRDLI